MRVCVYVCVCVSVSACVCLSLSVDLLALSTGVDAVWEIVGRGEGRVSWDG